MPVTRLNHAVMYVSNVTRSVAFYHDVMGFEPINMLPAGFNGAAFLRAPGSTNDHDLGLFEIGSSAGPSRGRRGQVGLYHLAWEVDTLADLQRWPSACRRRARSSARPTTAPPRACMPRTPTGSSSRSSG